MAQTLFLTVAGQLARGLRPGWEQWLACLSGHTPWARYPGQPWYADMPKFRSCILEMWKVRQGIVAGGKGWPGWELANSQCLPYISH